MFFFLVSLPILFPYPIVGSLLSILLQTLKPKDKAKGVESAPIVGSRRGNLPLQVEPNHKSNYHLVSVWIGIICVCDLSFAFSFLFFFFFGMRFRKQISLLWPLFINSSRTIWLFSHISAHQWVPCTVHKTHKPHFLAIFLLKIGPTVLFTHLKIILLQYF